MESFVMEFDVNIMAWNYLNNGMLLNLIKNLYVPFGKLVSKNGHDVLDFETRLGKIYRRKVHRVQVFDFGGLTDLMAEGLSGRMLMEHRDAQGHGVFISRAWRRLFEIQGLFLGGDRYRMSWRQFILALGLHIVEEMETAGFGLYWAESGMDVGPVNVPYLLARYLRLFASGRKQGAMLVMLHICEELDDTWAWVASRLERQSNVAAGAPKAAKDAPAVDKGALTNPAHMQLRWSIMGLRDDVNRPITDQSRFANWMVSCMTQLMDASGRTYQAFDNTLVGSSWFPYQRCTRRRTGDASTSTAQQDE
ncbi:hypothetical protein Tco_1195841 [Tanacetum coccineum]